MRILLETVAVTIVNDRILNKIKSVFTFNYKFRVSFYLYTGITKMIPMDLSEAVMTEITLGIGIFIWVILTALLIGAVGMILLIALMTHRDI